MSISVRNVVVEYASRCILNGIDLEIEAGEFVSIVGETGCGKSTLLRLILAEERPTRGQVLVQGKERARPDRTCGYVPQRYSLFPDKTVLDNVTFGLGFFRRPEFREEALRYLRHTGFMKPPVLLMDEAFSALDPGTRRGMQRLIKDLWRESGTTVVFVTHNTREAVCLGTRVIALAKRDERGSSIALDLHVPHLDFDSDEEELARLIAKIELNAGAVLSMERDDDASPVHTRTRV